MQEVALRGREGGERERVWDKGGRREGEEGRVGEKREGEREREGKREVHVYGWKVHRQIRRDTC